MAIQYEQNNGRDFGNVPIGSLFAWLKSLTSTPDLPFGWVECNGQVLSDTESVYNGVTIPDLNTTNRFLQGNSTSGGTGGSATMAHTHTVALGGANTSVNPAQAIVAASTYTTSGASNTENRPPFYNVVWILRVK